MSEKGATCLGGNFERIEFRGDVGDELSDHFESDGRKLFIRN